MRFSKKRSADYASFLITLWIALQSTSCLFQSKKKSGNSAGSQSSELILRDSLFFDRVEDRTSARITFKTRSRVNCSISYGPQDPLDTNKTPPRNCSNQQPNQQEFIEKISGLDPNRFYYLYITVTSIDDPRIIDSITVREPGSPANPSQPSTPGKKSPSSTNNPSDLITELFIARIDLVLKSGEVFRHVPKTPLSPEQIRAESKPQLGCFDQSPIKNLAFRSHDSNAKISFLATRDLGSANGVTRPELPGILNLDYSNISEGVDKWTFMFQIESQDRIHTTKPIIRLSKVELVSDQTTILGYPDLSNSPEPVRIDNKRDLSLQWTIPPQTPSSSYIYVQIGRSTLQKSVFCVFQADLRRGLISTQHLGNLPPGQHVITVALATTIFSAKDKWMTITNDWRSGRIEK